MWRACDANLVNYRATQQSGLHCGFRAHSLVQAHSLAQAPQLIGKLPFVCAGSCWAYAVTSCIEGITAIAQPGGAAVINPNQLLTSAVAAGGACGGGTPANALAFLVEQGATGQGLVGKYDYMGVSGCEGERWGMGRAGEGEGTGG